MTIGDAQGPSGSGQLGPIPHLRLPRPEALFARRAERFAALAPGHTLGEYLEFLGRIASAQLAAWETVEAQCRISAVRPSTPVPSGPALRTSGNRDSEDASSVRPERSAGGAESKDEDLPPPPLDVSTHRRDPCWRAALRVLVTELSAAPLPAESRAALDRIASAAPEALEGIADRVLANAVEGSDLAAAPVVAAALQVYFGSLAAGIDAESVTRRSSGCPVCGSLPAVGVVLADDPLRYLVCSVCATQWHHTRIQCTACHSGEGISYYELQGERAAAVPSAKAAKAEACAACRAYTKLLYVEKDPRIEPLADDVATLALDLLMAEEGWVRHGVNLLLVHADAEESARTA